VREKARGHRCSGGPFTGSVLTADVSGGAANLFQPVHSKVPSSDDLIVRSRCPRASFRRRRATWLSGHETGDIVAILDRTS